MFYGLGLKRQHGEKTLDVNFVYMSDNESAEISSFIDNCCTQDTDVEIKSLDSFSFSNLVQKTNDKILKQFHETYKMLSQKATLKDPGYYTYDAVMIRLNKGDQAVGSAEEAYFKLHLLSHRLVTPHGLNLNGAFGKLVNIAWSNYGPLLPEDVSMFKMKMFAADIPLSISHVDKFPYLVNYHIPTGVRIASGSQVRLGAYLGEGTTVMPAGYVNFNAGTQGEAMVEGRVSAGVFVGDKSDVGGGASIMGTLSGGNAHVISIGAACLLGANSGTGISLGYGCTIQAGLYLTSGMKISLYDTANTPVSSDGAPTTEGNNIVKARELSGKDNLLFMQDSQTGKVLCKPNNNEITLNSALHQND